MLLVYYHLYITHTLAGFLFDLGQSKAAGNIQKIESLVRKCPPIHQKTYNKITKRLRTLEEVEQYFPDFIAFVDCSEERIPRPKNKERRKIYYIGKKKRHYQKSTYG